MGYFVERLNRPYDFRVPIEAYIYTQRKDFVPSDFTTYYASLVKALQELFGIRLAREGFELLSFPQEGIVWPLPKCGVLSNQRRRCGSTNETHRRSGNLLDQIPAINLTLTLTQASH